MHSRHDPADLLADIIENAERVAAYLVGMERDAFMRDGRTRDAVERCMERVCEAANRLGKRAAELMPNQPGPTSLAWVTVCGMPMTVWTSTSSGTRRAIDCRRLLTTHGKRSQGYKARARSNRLSSRQCCVQAGGKRTGAPDEVLARNAVLALARRAAAASR